MTWSDGSVVGDSFSFMSLNSVIPWFCFHHITLKPFRMALYCLFKQTMNRKYRFCGWLTCRCVFVCVIGVSFDINTAGLCMKSLHMSLSGLSTCCASRFVFHWKLINLLFFFFLSHTRGSHHRLSLILCSHSTGLKGKCDSSYYHLIAWILAERLHLFHHCVEWNWLAGSGAVLRVRVRRWCRCWCCWILCTELCFWVIVAWVRLWEERTLPLRPPSSPPSLLLLPPFFHSPPWRHIQLLHPPTPSDVLSPPLASFSSFHRGRAESPWSPAAPAPHWKKKHTFTCVCVCVAVMWCMMNRVYFIPGDWKGLPAQPIRFLHESVCSSFLSLKTTAAPGTHRLMFSYSISIHGVIFFPCIWKPTNDTLPQGKGVKICPSLLLNAKPKTGLFLHLKCLNKHAWARKQNFGFGPKKTLLTPQ